MPLHSAITGAEHAAICIRAGAHGAYAWVELVEEYRQCIHGDLQEELLIPARGGCQVPLNRAEGLLAHAASVWTQFGQPLTCNFIHA